MAIVSEYEQDIELPIAAITNSGNRARTSVTCIVKLKEKLNGAHVKSGNSHERNKRHLTDLGN